MRSTDMFLSADSRKNQTTPLVLPEQNAPTGKAFSPYLVSLWDMKNISSPISHPKNSGISLKKISEKRGDNTKQEEAHEEGKTETLESSEDFTLHSLPESLAKVPSREDQIAKVKRAMSQFEEISKKQSRSEKNSFFRNLRKLI